MHSPSQSMWSSDGEEVHSVTLDFLFIGIRTITVLWRCRPGAEPVLRFLRPAYAFHCDVHQLDCKLKP